LHYGGGGRRIQFIGGAYSVDEPGLQTRNFPVMATDNKNKKRTDMNTLEIKGDWNITKGKLKEKWAKLTDNDLRYTEGKQQELVGRIQKLTGETREVVENAIKDFSSSCGCK
jgi:uncharacterized protein YjbJ (UPF0337 family)